MSIIDELRVYYMDQPHEISLETQALCNAACTFCPYPTLDRKGTKMPDEMLDRLIDEMAEFKLPFALAPFKVNEPLLDKRLIPFCQKFNEKVPLGFLRIFTNGSALTGEKIDQIASLKRVVHLWISLNSHDPVEYEALMGMPFERTAKRLDDLHSRSFPHPVVLSCVGFPNEPFRKYCFERWPKFESYALKRDSWLGFTNGQVVEIPATACSRWWELSILATGVVSHCCMDGEGKFQIGDLSRQTLLEVYNSQEWRQHREAENRLGIQPCSTCTY